MEQSQKQFKFKILGATLTVLLIMIIGVQTTDLEGLKGQITLHPNLEQIVPQQLDIKTDNVAPGELIEIQLVGSDEKPTTLPKDWSLEVSYFPQANIESVVASTIEKTIILEDTTYKFNAPTEENLYKIALKNDQGQIVGFLGKLNVQSSIDKK